MNKSRVDVVSGQTLSLAEREIEFMLMNSFRSPRISDVWTGRNLSAQSAGRAAADRFEAEQFSGKVPWQVELRAFCSEASVVGLRYVANPSASPFRRSVWLLLLLAGAAFTTFQIQNRIRWYWNYPVSVNFRVEYKDEIRFPTVTICSENRITKSSADHLGKLLYSYISWVPCQKHLCI